ncbi:regulator of G-protein signaling 9-binding protein isoform X2 [Nelusetta ayraudi]|uniref:regulator of G-protein signaling 9-binding protein isoform X2 n=1 Tax=Nelusetta ayraudi TaxID=303726 RepID=UPI003F6FB4E2
MSRWRSSVEEVAARQRQQGECQRGQEALSRVTSCFQQLAASLGSSADGSFLRDELEETRGLVERLSKGVADRQVLERLWVHFLSSLESFLSDLRKTRYLIGRFPLSQQSDRRSLVNSGCVDGMVGVAARVAWAQTPWISLGEEQSPDLTNHIAGLESMLLELQLRVRQDPSVCLSVCDVSLLLLLQVPVAFWSVEATQPAWAEPDGELEGRDHSLEELMEVEVASSSHGLHAPCCGLGCVG